MSTLRNDIGPRCPLCGIAMVPVRAWVDGDIVRYACDHARCAATQRAPLRIEPPETTEIRCDLAAGHDGMHEAQVPNPLGPESTNW